MKKKLIALLCLIVAVCCFTLAFSGCFGKEKRGELDRTDIHVVTVGNEKDLIRNKAFTKNGAEETKIFNFSNKLVQLFKFRARYDGTYTFKVEPECKMSIYIHSGNIVTDWWQELPCKQELYGGLEYSIEVKLGDEAYLNQDLQMKITTPPTDDKDISDCVSFVDDYTKGDVMYYNFTAESKGKYTFGINDFVGEGTIEIWENGRCFNYTGWGEISKSFTAGEQVTYKIKPDSYSKTTISGYVKRPPITEDITEALNEKGCLILELKPVFKEQIMKIGLIAGNEPIDITLSCIDVGVKYDGRDYHFLNGYGLAIYKKGDTWYYMTNDYEEVDYTVEAGKTLEIELKIPSYHNGNSYFLTVFKKGVEKHYLEYPEQ